MRRRDGRLGFTIVEVLIGSAIFATVGLALAASLAQGHELVQLPREEAVARHAIRSKLTELTAARFDLVARDYHGSGFECPPLRAAQDDLDELPGEVRFGYGPGGVRSMYTVQVRVRWVGRRGPREIETIAYLSNIRGDTGTPVPLEDLDPPGGLESDPGGAQ